MANRFQQLMHEILTLDHTPEEWTTLKKEYDKAMLVATEEEEQAFVDSGAGEAVYMASVGF